MLVHWKYGKADAAQRMGYWANADMELLLPEYIELFEFLFPDLTLLLNMDWSSNHANIPRDSGVLTNM